MVDILSDIEMKERNRIVVEEVDTQGKLTLLRFRKKGELDKEDKEETDDEAEKQEQLQKGIFSILKRPFKYLKNKIRSSQNVVVEAVHDLEEFDQGEAEPEPRQTDDSLYWRVTPYDLGGHTSYFNSQRLFTSGSSVFFLAFQRQIERAVKFINEFSFFFIELVSQLTTFIQKLEFTLKIF